MKLIFVYFIPALLFMDGSLGCNDVTQVCSNECIAPLEEQIFKALEKKDFKKVEELSQVIIAIR